MALQKQMGQLTKLVSESIVPVVNNLKQAYDYACEYEEFDSDTEGQIIEDVDIEENVDELPTKKIKTSDTTNECLLDKLEKVVQSNDVNLRVRLSMIDWRILSIPLPAMD